MGELLGFLEPKCDGEVAVLEAKVMLLLPQLWMVLSPTTSSPTSLPISGHSWSTG